MSMTNSVVVTIYCAKRGVWSYVVCIVGKMARGGVEVLLCHPGLVCFVFESSIPTALVLFRKLFCDLLLNLVVCFLLYFVLFRV